MKIEVIDGIFIRQNETSDAKGDIWLIHAFADSGLCFREVFGSPLVNHYNIYVPDLPGFGASPFNQSHKSIKDYSLLLDPIIRSKKSKVKTVIVAHSASGLIGTWLCESMKNYHPVYINVEGNLTSSDNYFTGKTLLHDNEEHFFSSFSREVYKRSLKDEVYKRYYSSLQFADPRALMMMGRSACSFSESNKSGHDFKNLTCRKVYIYGDRDTSQETIGFLLENNISAKCFKGVGHWHMIENTKKFYRYIQHFIEDDQR